MENFISLAKKYRGYLMGCFSCNLVWLRDDPPKEIFWEIRSVALEMNQQRLSIPDLFKHGILLSHGLCPECMARSSSGESFRASQLKEGNFPCFGSARHGYCDREDCKYRRLCVWDENLHPQGMAYYSRFYERMTTHQPPISVILRV